MSVFTKPHLLDTRRWEGKRIGLLGGSFNPPHEGHVHISKAALHGLKLDYVWWLVTPQNPLKKHNPGSVTERMALADDLIDHPRILITDMETRIGTNYTFETIRYLQARYSKSEFVWISGMDNALTMHHWQRWRDLLKIVPTLHITRMPATSLIQNCHLRLHGPQKHIIIDKGYRAPLDSGTTYWLLQKSMVDISSTELRIKH